MSENLDVLRGEVCPFCGSKDLLINNDPWCSSADGVMCDECDELRIYVPDKRNVVETFMAFKNKELTPKEYRIEQVLRDIRWAKKDLEEAECKLKELEKQNDR